MFISTRQPIVKNHNPLSDLISDEIYALLANRQLLSKCAVRNFGIQAEFRALRNQYTTAADALSIIRERHPYLQHDTIRKIVYKNSSDY